MNEKRFENPEHSNVEIRITAEEEQELLRKGKVKITRLGSNPLRPGEYIQLFTESGSILRGRAISRRTIEANTTEYEFEYSGE